MLRVDLPQLQDTDPVLSGLNRTISRVADTLQRVEIHLREENRTFGAHASAVAAQRQALTETAAQLCALRKALDEGCSAYLQCENRQREIPLTELFAGITPGQRQKGVFSDSAILSG